MTHIAPHTPARYTLHLGNRGRIVLPAEVRHQLDLKDGDRLILTVEADGSLRLTERPRSRPARARLASADVARP